MKVVKYVRNCEILSQIKFDIARCDLAKLPDENAKDVYDLIRMYHSAMMSIRSVFYSYGDAVVKGLEKATLKHENEVSNYQNLY